MLIDFINAILNPRGVYKFLEGGCGCGEQKKIIIIFNDSQGVVGVS